MALGMMVVQFRLSGCRSLKEKRRRLSGIRQRYGRFSHLAVCESAYQDDHKLGEWQFVALGSDAGFVERALQAVESEIEDTVDAELIDVMIDVD